MNSPKRRKMSGISPSDEKESTLISPTLIVLWGGDELRGLREEVESRLATYARLGAFRWLEVQPEQQGVREEIARAWEPLLSLHLWQQLVSAGYQPGLPDATTPVTLQLIIIVDRMKSKGADLPPLDEIVGESRNILKGRGALSSILIWLGERPDLPENMASLFRSRIRMESSAAGGLRADPSQILESLQHLLIALLLSNFAHLIRQITPRDAEWLVVGASALVLHPDAERWLQEDVLEGILAPLVAPLPEADCALIKEAMKKRDAAIREALLREAVAALGEVGWKMELEERTVRNCVLTDTKLLEATFGPYRGVNSGRTAWKEWLRRPGALFTALTKPFLSPPDLEEKLYQHYVQATETLKEWLWEKPRGLTPQAAREYNTLKVFLGGFLDRGVLNQAQAPDAEPRLPWMPDRPLPSGLPAALVALFALEKHLADDPDVEDACRPARETVHPVPLGGEVYLRAAAEADAGIVRGSLLRYAHFARMLASPLGALLFLFPAWPLVTLLLQVVVDWNMPQALLVSGLALLITGIAELVYWWLVRAPRLLRAVQRKAYESFARRIMAFMAQALRDHRYWMLGRLRQAEMALEDVYISLLQRYEEARKVTRSLRETPIQERRSTYILLDIKELGWRKEQATSLLHTYSPWLKELSRPEDFGSAVTALIAREVWPLTERLSPGRRVMEELETACRETLASVAPAPGRWKAGVAAEEVDGLRQGKRWGWLWRHAHPLGNVASPGETFTVILGSEELLSGPAGRESPYWGKDWKVTATAEGFNEEICIRGIVERRE